MAVRMVRPALLLLIGLVMLTGTAHAQRGGRGGGRGGRGGAGGPAAVGPVVLHPAHVFTALDEKLHDGWSVVVQGGRITAAGPTASVTVPADAKVIELPTMTLMPGIIEGHGHFMLHPYDEESWNNQVLFESLGLRFARAVVAAKTTLMAGITTERDLGTEGAGYADVELKDAINRGIIPGPRILASTKAIVGLGAYNVKGAPEWKLPVGAEEAGNPMELEKIIRDQIGKGADWIKMYEDGAWGRGGHGVFTLDEMKKAVEIAGQANVQIAVHTSSADGMKISAEAKVGTIEHGDNGTPEIFKLMKNNGVAFCPTLAATDATAQQGGWNKGTDPEPRNVTHKREMFKLAMASGVEICMGGDVGVYSHGTNVREMVLMVDYGMSAPQALISGTSRNAKIFRLTDRGAVQQGLMADLIAVEGDPTKDIMAMYKVGFVMKGGEIVKQPQP